MNNQLFVTIKGYYYKKSGSAHLVQGIKGNKVPRRAVAGGNGSFIIGGEPPKIFLNLDYSDGSNTLYNIYDIVKAYTARERVTEKYANEICDFLLNEEINIPDGEKNAYTYLTNKIDELVQNAIEMVG